jgi:anti-sigma regulatory factor (Ser/Thr protein kinase)
MTAPASMHLSLASRLDDLEPARQQVEAFLAPLGVPARTRYAVELVLEEAFMNIVTHAYADGAAHHRIGLALRAEPEALVLELEDDGRPFDPRQHHARPTPASLAEAIPGGLGVALMRRHASAIDYARVDGCNRLTITIAREAPRPSDPQ